MEGGEEKAPRKRRRNWAGKNMRREKARKKEAKDLNRDLWDKQSKELDT